MIGIGNPSAGDDGVGRSVLRSLRSTRVPPGIELTEVSEPSALIPRLEDARLVVLIDAVLGGAAPGAVRRLTPEQLSGAGITPRSTHGIGVVQAIELARTLSPERVCKQIVVVGVTISAAERYCDTLSPAVAEAVPHAVTEVMDILGGCGAGN